MGLTHSFRYRCNFWPVYFIFFPPLLPCAHKNELKEDVSKQPLTKCELEPEMEFVRGLLLCPPLLPFPRHLPSPRTRCWDEEEQSSTCDRNWDLGWYHVIQGLWPLVIPVIHIKMKSAVASSLPTPIRTSVHTCPPSFTYSVPNFHPGQEPNSPFPKGVLGMWHPLPPASPLPAAPSPFS